MLLVFKEKTLLMPISQNRVQHQDEFYPEQGRIVQKKCTLRGVKKQPHTKNVTLLLTHCAVTLLMEKLETLVL